MTTIWAVLSAAALSAALWIFWSLISKKYKVQRSKIKLSVENRRLFKERMESVAAEEAAASKEEADPSWEGFRPFFVNRKIQEAENIVSLYIAPVDQEILPPFRPGQFLTVRIPAEKAAGQPEAGKKFFIRCYSLSDSPFALNHYRLTIKVAQAPSKTPSLAPGVVSSFFNDIVQEGDVIEAKAASGQFHLDLTQASPIVLIAGGIGVTPILSMINAVVESGSARQVWFFYGVRNGKEHAFKEHLKRIAEENPNFHYHVNYSDPLPGDQLGSDYHEKGRLDIQTIKNHLPFGDFDFYICGPGGMMDDLIESLLRWGVPLKNIFYEAFGPSTVKRRELGQADQGVQITFSRSGKTFPWGAKNMSLLEFAEAQGIKIDFGCRLGNCGTCETALVQGKVKMPDNVGYSLSPGCILPCVSVPASDIIIDA